LPEAGPGRRGGSDQNTRINGDHAGLIREHRIEIDLANFREVGGELRQFDEKERNRGFVCRGNIAVGLKNARDARSRDEPARQRQVQRRQRQRLVIDDFDGGAALAEHNDRAEGRIVGHADNQFARLRTDHHRKYHHPDDASVRFGGARPVENVGRGLAHRLLAGEVEPYAPDIRFVHDVGRLNFQDHGIAVGEMRPRRDRSLVRIARQTRRRYRDAVSR